jgi:hypothetical protein
LTRGRQPSLALVAGAAVALAGLAIGSTALGDNSFFTHLATGRLILHDGIPRTDPYSFTAAGHPWVVQSWLPSLLYGLVDRWWGGHGLVLMRALQTLVLAALVWRLSRPAETLISRILTVVPVLFLGAVLWTSRPLLFGLLLLACCVVLAEEDRPSPWWLLAIGWLWVNSHGSFPFGPLYFLCRLAGRALDREPRERLTRLFSISVAGVVLGALNPLGPRLLTFPLHVLGQREVLSRVVEWRSPNFSEPWNLAFLLEVVLALVLLVRRPSWEDGVVAAVFGLAGALALRNTVVASIALVPVLARGMRGIGAVRGERRSGAALVALAAVALLGVPLVSNALGRPAYDLKRYPVAELRWMGQQGLLSRRVAAQDFVGNLRTLREGPHHEVFMDDRYDMYPISVSSDFLALDEGRPRSLSILDRHHIDVVLWDRHKPLAALVSLDPHWRVVHGTKKWLVAERA